MTLDEYGRHLIGPLCWWCHRATHRSSGRQRRCPGCRAEWGYHRRTTGWELLRAFGLSATAHHAARVVGCGDPTAHATYTRFRLAVQALTDQEKRPLLGRLELDESYFGGRRKGKRGRGAGGKVPVFGILGRAGRVYTVAVPNEPRQARPDQPPGGVRDRGRPHQRGRGVLELRRAAVPARPRGRAGERPARPGRVRVPVRPPDDPPR